jgi:protocatechuate 3,4-dioxygenase beta subunit
MYFREDPLFAYDPVMNSVTDERARRRMIASFAGVPFAIRLQGENETDCFDV